MGEVTYVWAQHDFTPEHDDEIAFRAGDRIEIVERDELYGDGWWQGRDPSGKVGLFPEAYTTREPPQLTHGAPLHALAEEPDEDKPIVPKEAPKSLAPGIENPMAATLTDVQAAIEQLGVRDGASRSFSFASTRTGGESESEPDADDEGGAWHRNARSALAAAAAREVDNRDSWAPPPPIPFELSDESEPEDDEHAGRGNDLLTRAQSPPPSANTITFRAKSPQYVVPSPSSPERNASPPPTATATSFRTQTSPLRSQTPRAASPRATSPLSVGPTSPGIVQPMTAPAPEDSPDASPVIPPSDDIHPPPVELGASRSQVLARATMAPLPASPAPPTPSASSFGPAQALAAALRSTSPAFRSASPAVRSASPAIRSASPVVRSSSPVSHSQPAPSTASLPTPVTPTLSRSPAPSVLSFSSNRYVDRRSSSPYPPPTSELPAPPVNHMVKEARTPTPNAFTDAKMFASPIPLTKEVSSPAPQVKDFATTHRDAITSPHIATRKYTNTAASVMGLPSPATSASGIAAAQSQNLSPTSARFRQASVTSEIPSVYPPSIEDYSTLPSSQWTLTHVLAWLTAKGFDQDVRKAFTENDITGDVLLELDAAALKDEIGITAFGKRTRLLKAIAELKQEGEKPKEKEKEKGSGTDTEAPASRFLGHAARSSAGWSSSRPGTPGAKEPEDESRLRVRHGNGNRPTSLVLSPSDGALATRQLWNPNRDRENSGNSGKSERGVLSEGEAPRKPDIEKSKQFFDNQTPTTTKTDPSESGSTPISSFPPSPSFKREKWNDKERVAGGDKDRLGAAGSTPKKEKDDGSVSGHSRGKRSIDGASTGKDRLSIFGNALGKGRKPAPRYSTGGEAASTANSDDRSHRSLSRLYMGSSSQRKPKERPSVPPISPVAAMDNDARKRTISGPVGGMRSSSPAAPTGGYTKASANLSPHIPQRTLSTTSPTMARSQSSATVPGFKPGEKAVDQIGEPDYSGWMRKKGDRYNSWKLRYFVLKGPHLYYLRSRTETKIKGYVNITGYKVIADENANPGRYGFRIVHDSLKPHFFSSEEQVVVREWMKALMKATIARNFNDPVRSSCNIPTIPLAIAQQMNPAPRPPSPSEREAAQRAARRENPNQLSSRDARILMGLPENGPAPREPSEQHRMNSFFVENGQQPMFDGRASTAGSGFGSPAASSGYNSNTGYNGGANGGYNGGGGYNGRGYERASMAETEGPMSPVSSAAPTRPSREMRPRMSKTASRVSGLSTDEQSLLEWVNSRLPPTCPLAEDLSMSMASGLILFRLAEAIKETDSGVPDSAFPQGPGDDRLEGLFKLFDFLLDNDVRMGAVSINDVRNGNGEKIAQLVRSLRTWDEKRRAGPRQKQTMAAGPWMGITSY